MDVFSLSHFKGVRGTPTDFGAVDTHLAPPYFVYELDLSSARSLAAGTAAQLNLKGNVIYVDQNSDVGNATVIFNSDNITQQLPGRVFVQSGFNAKVPFTALTVENTAQAGKVLRIFYGVDINFQPGVTGTVALTGDVSVVNGSTGVITTRDGAIVAGVFFNSTATLGVGAIETVLLPAANTAGVRVWESSIITNAAAANYITLLAKSSSPANAFDGDVLHTQVAPSGYGASVSPHSWFVAAGKGLYFASVQAETAAVRTCKYSNP